jgi:hypothetical protein
MACISTRMLLSINHARTPLKGWNRSAAACSADNFVTLTAVC